MNYHPNGMRLWDAWFLNHNGQAHAFYLQLRTPDSERPAADALGIGHAVSDNLLDWEELPNALWPGKPGSRDDLNLFTGCAWERDGLCYLFYTQRSSVEDGRVQRIGLATSHDFRTFQKHAANPVVEPDPQFFCTAQSPARHGIVDCRDLIIHENPHGEGYYGFYAARMPSEEMPEGAAIACVFSRDLVHWESIGPVFTAKKHTIVEVPDVFYMDGRWYMTLLINNEYGSRDLFEEEELIMGTIYAVSDSITGPYCEEPGNVILASRRYNGITCRSLVWKGRRCLLYVQAARQGGTDSGLPGPGSMSIPHEYRVVDGKLRATYCDLIEEKCTGQRVTRHMLAHPLTDFRLQYSTPARWQVHDNGVSGSIRTCWDRYQLSASEAAFLFSVQIRVDSGAAAGVVFKQSDGYSGYGVILDYKWQKVLLACMPRVEVLDARRLRLEYGKTYHLRVVCTGVHYNVYVDDVLLIQSLSYTYRNGIMGLFLDRAEADFTELDIRGLNP